MTGPAPRRILLDTSVLAPEPLWLWMLALTDGIPEESRPLLVVTDEIIRELRPALRRVDPRLDRERARTAVRLRVETLTHDTALNPAPEAVAGSASHPACAREPARASDAAPPTSALSPPRPHVLDPDDAHLDEAALRLGIDVLVSDDVHAFAPLLDEERGYALLTADQFLCALADAHDLALVEAHDRYLARLEDMARALDLDPAPGSASHRLRRSRARRFATRVVRALRRA